MSTLKDLHGVTLKGRGTLAGPKNGIFRPTGSGVAIPDGLADNKWDKVPYYIDVAGAGNLAGSFASWAALKSVYLDNAAPTNCSSMFSGCSALVEAPAMDTSACTGMGSMFSACNNLAGVPAYDTGNVTVMSSMFANAGLTAAPVFNYAKVTDANAMFSACNTMPSFGDLNAPLLTNASNMFTNCSALASVGTFTLPVVTNVSSMFANCSALAAAPNFNFSAVTSFTFMLSGCSSLTAVPNYNFPTTGSLSLQGFLNGCSGITTVPAWNLTAFTGLTSTFTGMTALTSFLPTGMKATFSVAGSALGAAALDTMFTNLATVTAKTVTITGCPGAATCNRAIATAKGWTVTG